MSDDFIEPCDDGDVDGQRRAGRRVRSMADPFARGSAAHAPKCRECPKRDVDHGVCPLRGSYQVGGAPACRYGIVLIRAKRMADKRANTQKKRMNRHGEIIA